MKSLSLFILLISSPAWSALEMRPGLWEVHMKMSAQGKQIDPQAEFQKALNKMPPEQRKKMQEMMGKMAKGRGAQMAGNGMRLCYTKKMLQNEESITRQRQGQCQSTVTTREPKKVATEFTCKNGTKGTATWAIQDDSNYSGQVNTVDAKGHKSDVSYTGKFLSADCGDVKPIEVPETK